MIDTGEVIDTGELEMRMDEEAWQQIPGVENTILQSFEAAIGLKNMTIADTGATIVLSNNRQVSLLNEQWRDKPMPTNVLSFPACKGETNDNGKRYLGDIILAFEVVSNEAEAQGKALATHLCHLVIHGALHLMGFDHENDKAADEMEDLERTAMNALELPDPYLPATTIQKTNF